MRKIASHVWVRLAVIALLVPLIWGCVTHIFGILILSENHALIEEGTGAEEEFTASLMQRDIRRIKQAYLYPEAGNETVQNDIQINLRERFKPESSNFLFTLYDTDHNVLQMNELVSDEDAKVITVLQLTDNTMVKTISRSFSDEKSALAFEKQYRDQTAPGFDTTNIQWEWKDSNEIQVTITSYPVVKCTVNAALRNPMTVKDRYYYSIYGFRMLIRFRTWLLISTPFMVVAAVLLLIFLIYGVGHKVGREELVSSWTDKIPFDLFAVLLLFIAFLPRIFHFGSLAATYIEDYLTGIMLYFVMKLIRILLLLWLVLSLARRIKTRSIKNNLLILRLIRYLKRGIKFISQDVSAVWHGLLIWITLSALEAFAFFRQLEPVMQYIWIGEKLLISLLGIVLLVNLRTLERGSSALSRGDLHTKLELRGMLPGLRKYAGNLNGISVAMQRSVEERMKSEHMKAELITNVSHDIKTPLTSITSYVELLKREGLNSPNAEEYLAVLERQSNRLKKLTIDLVEASKASTGNIKVEAERIDVNLLLLQAAGEYEARMKEHDLPLVYDLCEGALIINADPRLLWRVFDNLLNNALKYAQKDTRIYVSTRQTQDHAEISFRNISGEMLNISPEELLERFVRGDASRNTDGSGLGLSISRSLTELQGGAFSIDIDGDLFKAMVRFPLAPQEQDGNEKE